MFGEQSQWCPSPALRFHDTVGHVLLKALGVDSAMRVSATCEFAIFFAPVDRESQDQVCGDQNHRVKNSAVTIPQTWIHFCLSVSFAALTHAGHHSRLASRFGEWRDLVFCCWTFYSCCFFFRSVTARCSVHVTLARVSG